ncbi:uncharacterized protein HaLaN_26227 [Haematococcus lacustris]|uniref:Uncharacterized protein n=1 Tax=Haematococcus lacustris TaxID=44745 RepID=A0A6A0A5Q8_HAELA|nr:uncharacterized protein HaLaN_26227 [Haematococcus lacustris]
MLAMQAQAVARVSLGAGGAVQQQRAGWWRGLLLALPAWSAPPPPLGLADVSLPCPNPSATWLHRACVPGLDVQDAPAAAGGAAGPASPSAPGAGAALPGAAAVRTLLPGGQGCEHGAGLPLPPVPAPRPPGHEVQHPGQPAGHQRGGDGGHGPGHAPAADQRHRQPPQAPRSSQAATQPAASEPGPSTPQPAKRSKRTKAEPGAAEPTKGKAAKAKPAPQPGRWLDRDCNAALNMQRIGESRWRPLELCYWPDQGALPAKGKEYPGLGYKRLQDKPPKAQEQQQPAEAQ